MYPYRDQQSIHLNNLVNRNRTSNNGKDVVNTTTQVPTYLGTQVTDYLCPRVQLDSRSFEHSDLSDVVRA